MKNIILIIYLLVFFICRSDIYDLQIITKCVENQYLKIKIKNYSKKKLIFYYGVPQSEFKIEDKNGIENIGKVMSIASEEDYLDYQFDYSRKLIDETMKRYKISFQEAVIYLHYKKRYTLILPNISKEVDLPIISRNYTMAYEMDSTKSYFISVKAVFSTVYIPDYIRDSLKSDNTEIIQPKINSNRITVNSTCFFRKYKNLYIK